MLPLNITGQIQKLVQPVVPMAATYPIQQMLSVLTVIPLAKHAWVALKIINAKVVMLEALPLIIIQSLIPAQHLVPQFPLFQTLLTNFAQHAMLSA